MAVQYVREDTSYNVQGSGGRVTRRFHVRLTDDVLTDRYPTKDGQIRRAVDPETGLAVPQDNSPFPGPEYPGLVADDISYTNRRNQRNLYMVTVPYVPPEQKRNPPRDVMPWNEPWIISDDVTTFPFPLEYRNSSGQRVDNLSIDVLVGVLRVSRKTRITGDGAYSRATRDALVGKINDAQVSFDGDDFDERRFMLRTWRRRVSSQDVTDNGVTTSVEFNQEDLEFQIHPDEWKLSVPDIGTMVLRGGVLVPARDLAGQIIVGESLLNNGGLPVTEADGTVNNNVVNPTLDQARSIDGEVAFRIVEDAFDEADFTPLRLDLRPT